MTDAENPDQEPKTKTTAYDTLNKKVVERALSEVAKKEHQIFAEKMEKGFQIRIKSRSAAWYVRGRWGNKPKSWYIAPVAIDDDPAEMRKRAREAKDMARRGVPLTEIEDWLLKQRGEIVESGDPLKDGLHWPEAVAAYLAAIKDSVAAATYDSYRKCLQSPHLSAWNEKLAKNISADDIRKVQTELRAAGKKSQAQAITTAVKVLIGWAAVSGTVGISDTSAADAVSVVRPGKTEKAAKREAVKKTLPTPQDIGRLPWLLNKSGINQHARLASMMTTMTVQRRETIIVAQRRDFEPRSDGLTGLWRIPGTKTKSKMEHVIPLPPFTWAIVCAALAAAGGNSPDDWVFPQQRLRRAEDVGGGHMAAGGLNIAMRDAGSPIRPHINRKLLTTYGAYLTPRISEADAGMIMDHAEAKPGSVTSIHYNFDEMLMAKWQIMTTWEAFVVRQIKAQTPEGLSGFPAFIPYAEKPWAYNSEEDNLLLKLGAAM